MNMQISENGLKLIESFEGFRSNRYLDVTGTPTIGYGTTAAVVNPLPATCTQAEAEGWLKLYIERDIIPAIEATGCPLNQYQIDALCSFGYNLGSGIFNDGSSMANALHDKNLVAASNAFSQYVYSDGKVIPGLVTRRSEEKKLFDTPVVQPPVDPHHYDRFWSKERPVVEQYDVLRAKQTATEHPDRVQLTKLRAQLHFYAVRVWTISHTQQIDGKPSWDKYYRGWRWQQLTQRAKGERLV